MTFSRWTLSAALAAGLSGMASGARAQAVDVQNAWARATVQGQKATGAFMTLKASTDAKLVSVSSPVAGVAEVHEMKMEGDVMKMRAFAAGLDLPAGKSVELKPGGYHIMLMDLKKALPAGEQVDLSLVFEGRDKKRETVDIKAEAKAGAKPAAAGHDAHKH